MNSPFVGDAIGGVTATFRACCRVCGSLAFPEW